MSAPFSRKLAILAAALVCTVSPLRADEPVDDRIAVRKAVLLAFDYISTNGKSVTSPVWASATPFKGDGPYAMSWFAAAKDALKPQSRNVKRIQIDEDKAWAYLTYEMETPPKSARFVQYEAIFRLVRDGQDWKLWSATEPYIDLCRVLDQAKDAEERLAVLKCHKQWATVFLVVKLNQLAFQDLRVKKLAGATRWNELAFEAAAFVPDRQSEAWCRLNRGLIGEERKKYADAQADFEEALKGFRATGQIQGESIALLHLGRVLAAREDYAKAKAQFDAAKELLDDLGYSVPMNDRVDGVTAWTFNLLDEQARLNERILDHFAAEEFAAAVPLFASLKNVEQTIFGAVSVDLTESLLNEAYARARLGELEEAAVLAEKAAAIHAKLCGSRDGRTRYSLLQAGVHRKLAGFSADERRRFWDALLKVQRSQKQLQQITRKEMSKFQEARKLLEEAVETYRSLKLADSHLNALALQQLGSALAGLDERETAEKILRQAVAICRPILPPESPQCKAGLDQLCALLDIRVVTALKLDDQNAARRLQEEILTIRTFQHGKKHHSILKPRWMLEHILRLADLAPEQRRRVRDAQDILTTGDLARTSGVIDLKRITAMKQAANDLRAILGEEDCIVYQANWSIIDELSNNNCFRDATPFLERQLVSLQRNGGKALGHPDYWNYLCRTAVRTVLDGDLRLAEDLFLRTIEMLKQDGLSGSPEYQMVSLALQALYQVMDDMDKAAAHLFPLLQKLKREIFVSRARGSGTARLFNITWARNKSPQLLERLAVTYRTIGHSYYRNHLTSEAESIFQEVARIWHFLGPAWKNSYGGTLIDLAQVHVSQGRLKEAEAEFDEARGLLGDTFEIVRARAWLLCRLKKFDEAREFMLQQLQKNEENPLDFMLWLNQFFLEDLLIIEQATRRLGVCLDPLRLLEHKGLEVL